MTPASRTRCGASSRCRRACTGASTLDEVVPTLDAVERARARRPMGRRLRRLRGRRRHSMPALAASPAGPLPLAWFATFDAPAAVDAAPARRLVLDRQRSLRHRSAGARRATVSDRQHADRIAGIHELIDAGDVYQVNLTVPFTAPRSTARHVAFYERMRLAQGGRYSPPVSTSATRASCRRRPSSSSSDAATVVRTRPMKGTMRRGPSSGGRSPRRATRFVQSEKERAENVMIVDVVRNDLGTRRAHRQRATSPRSARRSGIPASGSSRRPSKRRRRSRRVAVRRSSARSFRLPRSPARRRSARRQIIARAGGRSARASYCGAIGVIRPGGDATFNVAIRTAWTATRQRRAASQCRRRRDDRLDGARRAGARCVSKLAAFTGRFDLARRSSRRFASSAESPLATRAASRPARCVGRLLRLPFDTRAPSAARALAADVIASVGVRRRAACATRPLDRTVRFEPFDAARTIARAATRAVPRRSRLARDAGRSPRPLALSQDDRSRAPTRRRRASRLTCSTSCSGTARARSPS